MINFNIGTNPTTTTIKTCPRQHALTLTNGPSRKYPTCDLCGIRGLQQAYTCYPCNYDLCSTCFASSGNIPSGIPGGFLGPTVPSTQLITTTQNTCLLGHTLNFTNGFMRNYPICDRCKAFKLPSSYCCQPCNYDLCATCYQSNYQPTTNVKIESNPYNPYEKTITTTNLNTGTNLYNPYQTQPLTTNLITGTNPYNPYQTQPLTTNITTGTNPYNSYQAQTNITTGTSPYNYSSEPLNTNVKINLGQGSVQTNVEFKTCRKNHYDFV